MDDKIVLKSMISYILYKDNKLSKKDVKEIVCVADIHHFILFGRTISNVFINNNEYLFYDRFLNEVWEDIEKEFEKIDLYLSISDKECLDLAINRQGIDSFQRFFSRIEL